MDISDIHKEYENSGMDHFGTKVKTTKTFKISSELFHTIPLVMDHTVTENFLENTGLQNQPLKIQMAILKMKVMQKYSVFLLRIN